MSLGEQALTGTFPQPGEVVPVGLLSLVVCEDCLLVQLSESFPLDFLYGENYGYRSGLNQSMVSHLRDKAESLSRRYGIGPSDLILDIGSNDGTFLSFFPEGERNRFGMDPVGSKFVDFYPPGVELIPEFFSAESFSNRAGAPAKLVSSISMFYDLERPVDFASQVEEILTIDGIWHLEQSYLPSMLASGSFDTVCHEHLEYYSLISLRSILDRAGLRVIRVDLNQINGGSFALDVCKKDATYEEDSALLGWLERQEQRIGLGSLEDIVQTFSEFSSRVETTRAGLVDLLTSLRGSGKKVLGYGASTKGNVLLQSLGVTSELLPSIAEVNPYKFGRETPGSRIPIISEAEARESGPDFFLVLPWHFRDSILRRETEFLSSGGKFIFPLPDIEIFGL